MKERLASKIFSELEKDILTGRYEVNSKQIGRAHV